MKKNQTFVETATIEDYQSMHSIVIMLVNKMRPDYIAATGKLTALAIKEGWNTIAKVEEVLLLKSRFLICPSVDWDTIDLTK